MQQERASGRLIQTAGGPQPFGILNSMAVLLSGDAALAWVDSGSATGNVDVRIGSPARQVAPRATYRFEFSRG